MGLCCGMIGLPNVGKTTVFNALTGGGALAANYPFATVDPNTGVALVPDPRLVKLTEMFASKKTTYSTLEVRDIAGLVEGASKGEGLGNQFLGHIREVDALLHVVRCFQSTDVVHVSGGVDPLRDIGVIETELMLSDLETLDRRKQKTEKKVRAGDKKAAFEVEFLTKLIGMLDQGSGWAIENTRRRNGRSLRSVSFSQPNQCCLSPTFRKERMLTKPWSRQ